jgi:hypothetical protein
LGQPWDQRLGPEVVSTSDWCSQRDKLLVEPEDLGPVAEAALETPRLLLDQPVGQAQTGSC